MGKNKEYQLAIRIAGEIDKSLGNSVNLTQRQLRGIAVQAAKASSETKNSFASGFDDIEKGLNSFDNVAGKVFSATAEAAAVAATAVTGIAVASIGAGKAYEAQMSTVQSISNATADDMALLEAKAQEMGATTVFSATEAGQAMEYMAMAGWKTEDMLSGIEGIMNLAAASGEDLGTTSDIVTDALTAFGLTAAESTRLADVMAAASSNANTNVAMMGETFSYVAPIAGALGYSIEDTSLAIGLLANSGIKSSAAGTALRKIFSNTAQGIELTSAALGKYRIETANADGSMRELAEVLPELREAFSTMTEQEQAANAEAIAGKTAMSGLLAMVNASETDYNKLAEAIDNSAGAAERMAEIKIDNLEGDFTLLKSAAEGAGIEIYEQMDDVLRSGTQLVTSFISESAGYLQDNNFIEDFGDSVKKSVPTIIRNVKQAGEAIGEFAEPFLDVGEWMLDNPDVISGTLAGIGTTIVSLKVAVGVKNLATSFMSLAGVLTNPFALGIAGVAAALGGAVGLATAIKKANKEAAKQNLAEHFGKISLSIDELSEAANHILDDGSLTKLSEAMNAFDEVEGFADGIEDALEEVNKLNWKVSIGMELDETEQQSYQESIASFIEQSQKAIEQKQYAMSLNLQLFTDNDETGEEIRNKFSQFYQSNYETVSDLGTQLQEAVNAAFSDGLLTIDETQKIQELQNQIANITEQIAGSEFDAKMDVLGMKFSGGDLDPESFKNLQEQIQTEVDAAVSQYDEALQMNIASAKVMLKQGEIDTTEYDNMVAEFKENYLQQLGDVELKAQNFSLNTIMEQYGDELNAAIPDFQEQFNAAMSEAMNVVDAEGADGLTPVWHNLYNQIENIDSLDSTTKEAISQLLEQMQPGAEDMQKLADQYTELGYQVPTAIMQGITEAATLGAMADGDSASIWALMTNAINNDEDYTALVNSLNESGGAVPPEIVKGMEANKGVLTTEAQNLYNTMQTEITERFKNAINVTATVNVQTKLNQLGQNPVGQNQVTNIPAYASGGLIQNPTLATFAEEGPEMAIPIDGSARSISLWEQAGEMLGVKPSATDDALNALDGSSNVQTNTMGTGNAGGTESPIGGINFAPQYIIQGNASKEEMEAINQDAFEKFELMMEKYLRNKGRFSYA